MSHITTKIRLHFPTGYEPRDIIGTSSFDWIRPDEVEAAWQLHWCVRMCSILLYTIFTSHVQLEFHVHPFPPLPSVLTLPQSWNNPTLAPLPSVVVPPNPSYDDSFLTLPTHSECIGLILNRFS